MACVEHVFKHIAQKLQIEHEFSFTQSTSSLLSNMPADDICKSGTRVDQTL